MTELDNLMKLTKISPAINLNRKMYFDESNNIRRGKINFDSDNNVDLENTFFVLGGIATKVKLNFNELLNYIGAKQVPNDAKFSFFSFKKNKFENAIEQSRLRKLFEYLLKNKIIIHFSVFHYYNFQLVEILDSLISDDDKLKKFVLMNYKQFQSDIVEVLYQDFKTLHNILYKYEFPNIQKGKSSEFLKEIYNLYTYNLKYFDLRNPDNESKILLHKIIELKLDKKELIFLKDNKPYIISESLTINYINRMLDFYDIKYFDIESKIIEEINEMDKNYKSKLNVDFINSKDSREIQVSDAICGFVARLYNFISHNSNEDIINFCKHLKIDSESYKTLKAFFELMTFSDNISYKCFMKTNPLYIDKKFDLLFNNIIKK